MSLLPPLDPHRSRHLLPCRPSLMTRKASTSRERLDRAMVSRGLAESREQAHRLLLAGAVRVNDVLADKPARLVSGDAKIEVRGPASPFVSRGGEKLDAALTALSIDPRGLVALDVGASTGGFTDCLLQRQARRVYAVDVGFGQLDWRLRRDHRVVVLERENIRYLPRASVPDPIDLAVIDVSFISLALVLPCVVRFLAPEALVVALVKPQFEVGRRQVGRGGIVRDEGLRRSAADKVLAGAQQLGLTPLGMLDSPVLGKKGNREILIGLRGGRSHAAYRRVIP